MEFTTKVYNNKYNIRSTVPNINTDIAFFNAHTARLDTDTSASFDFVSATQLGCFNVFRNTSNNNFPNFNHVP